MEFTVEVGLFQAIADQFFLPFAISLMHGVEIVFFVFVSYEYGLNHLLDLADDQFHELIWSKSKAIASSSTLDLPILVYTCLNC